jgi:hypothetical protein
VYRGKILTVAQDQGGAVSVSFHSLPEVTRDKVILPEDLLPRIERQTIDAKALH